MNEIDSVNYPGEDSDWDIPYGYDASGNWAKHRWMSTPEELMISNG